MNEILSPILELPLTRRKSGFPLFLAHRWLGGKGPARQSSKLYINTFGTTFLRLWTGCEVRDRKQKSATTARPARTGERSGKPYHKLKVSLPCKLHPKFCMQDSLLIHTFFQPPFFFKETKN